MVFLEFLSQYRTGAGDIFFQLITLLAQESFVILIICWLYWCSDKRLACTLAFSFFASGLLVQGLKITFRIPRPWVLDPQFQPVASAVPAATGYSFPSGHTQSITSLFGTLAFYTHRKSRKLLCFVVIFLVGFSRMYLGCHTPKDVIVSFLLSILCTAFCYDFFYQKDGAAKRELLVTAAAAALSLLLVVYAILLYRQGTILQEYAADCIKAGGAGLAFAVGYYIERTHLQFQAPDTRKGRLLRFFPGICVTLLLQLCLKPLLGESLAASFVRYFLVVFWVTALYPFLFQRHR